MSIGLREWLAIIGVLIILAIMADAVRRHYGRSTLKFKLDRKLINQFSEETESSEILGPARVVQSREPVLGESGAVAPNEPQVYPVAPVSFDNEPLDEGEPPITAHDVTPDADAPAAQAENNEISDIFIIYVESSSPDGFQGQDILQSVLESGMRFGDMDIFHRHENMTGTGDKLFSMANALNPGVFDLLTLEDFSTRSLCFFMSLPGPKQPKQAFELMLTAARKLANELGGELKDDSRSDLTGQTISHYRQRIVDFERRQMRTKHSN